MRGKNGVSTSKAISKHPGQLSFGKRLLRDFAKNKELYLLVLPVLIFYGLFHYGPMYGATIAFENFKPALGIGGSDWVGFKYFMEFFSSYYFGRLLLNTVRISFFMLVIGFPAPIILALLINEVKSKKFSRTVQTIAYMPHFVSLVVVCGMIVQFCRDTGFITQMLSVFGVPAKNMLDNPDYFIPMYVISGIWQEIGWGSIIYLAALAGIDQEQYEAAKIDGAGRWKQTIHVTLPGIMPQIIILFIMRMGNVLSVGYEKIILLYTPLTYEVGDVINSFVYRKGLLEFGWSYAAAVGFFNSVVNLLFLISANYICGRLSSDDVSLF
jgi:putative aldouronate transport system permease protein